MASSINLRSAFSLSIQALLLLIFLLSMSNAQITIPPSGFTNLLTVGSTLNFYKSDSIPRTLNIGKRAGPSVYDFSNYTFQKTGLSNVFSVGANPTLAARYPAKAITFGGSSETIANNPVFLFGTDTLFVVGNASLVPLQEFSHTSPYTQLTVFPITYLASRVATFMTYDTTYAATGGILSTKAYSGSDSMTVDGYGTLKILGRQFECLRAKLNHFTYSDKEFQYMTREGVFFDVMMASSERDTGVVQPSSVILLVPSSVTGVNQSDLLPERYSLDQNYPNPFNPTTSIRYDVSKQSYVTIKIFTVLGQEVRTLISEDKNAGSYSITFDARMLPSGVYFYRMTAGNYMRQKVMVLIR